METNTNDTSRNFKRVAAMIMAVMMIMSYAVFAATDYDKTVTFSNVKNGDTITAYRLVSYDSSYYNNYVFNEKFNAYVSTKNTVGNHTNAKYLSGLSNEGIGALLSEYAAEAQTVGSEYGPLPTAFTSGTAGEEQTVSLTLEPGYYMILGTTTLANSQIYSPTCVFIKPEGTVTKVYAGADGSEITSTLSVAMKTQNAPTLDKKTRNPDHDNESWSSSITAGADDLVEFLVKVDIPAFSDGTVLIMTVKDIMENMEYKDGTVKVYSDEDCLSEITGAVKSGGVIAGTYDTDNHTQSLDIELDFNAIHPEANSQSTIYVYYQATLHEDSSVNNADAKNTAKLQYSNSVTPDIVSKTPDSSTDVDLFELILKKTDESGNALAGAKFKVYTNSVSTEPIKFKLGTSGYYPDTNGEITELPCDSNGQLHIVGLDVGSYYFEESTQPVGYYAPNGRFVLNLVHGGEKNTLSETTSFGAVNSADNSLVDTANSSLDDDKMVYTAVLKNSSTPILPTAGGMGTIAFTFIGIIIMAAAVTMAIIYKRKTGTK